MGEKASRSRPSGLGHGMPGLEISKTGRAGPPQHPIPRSRLGSQTRTGADGEDPSGAWFFPTPGGRAQPPADAAPPQQGLFSQSSPAEPGDAPAPRAKREPEREAPSAREARPPRAWRPTEEPRLAPILAKELTNGGKPRTAVSGRRICARHRP